MNRSESWIDTFECCFGPFNLNKHKIRLVVLQSPREHDTIECSIINTTQNVNEESSEILNESKYEALPYTSGSPVVKRIISIDGQTCTIRENLWLALYDIPSPFKEQKPLLWIDALCIDQNDTRERNQVSQMDEVFKHANRVLVWLGLEAPEDPNALEFIKNTNLQLTLRTANDSSYHFDIGSEAKAWKTVARLCQRVYWTGLWIIQEVHFAAKMVLYSGSSSCD